MVLLNSLVLGNGLSFYNYLASSQKFLMLTHSRWACPQVEEKTAL